jgi:hypothetical protein
MSATVSEIKKAISDAVASIDGVRSYDRQPDQINPPFAFPQLERIEYHGAMRAGLVTQTYLLSVVVGRAAERSSERLLDQFLSYDEGGIRYAIESDTSLGGFAQTSVVEEATAIRTLEGNDGTLYLSADFRVIVYA